MTTSISIHGATSVTAGSVHYDNANAISLVVRAGQHTYDITLFNLPAEAATHISEALSGDATTLSEVEVRADERKKIAAGIGLLP